MLPPRSDLPGHEVTNQPPARGDTDLWERDPILAGLVTAFGGEPGHTHEHARKLGQAIWRERARDAARHPPELRLFDAGGRRLDEVVFHPAYHQFLELGLGAGYAADPWQAPHGGHVHHAALVYLHSQVEPGSCCPMTMTYAAVPVLTAHYQTAADWVPKLLSRRYDPSARPLAEKAGATLGMAMTEKQGGSDVRANTSWAERNGEHYRLTGHKWFCSAPMSDGFLTLAQAPGGLSCFLVPRWLAGGRNRIHLMRLKDKLGNRANASAEVEFHGAEAMLIGEEGRGISTIMEMVHHTRLDTAAAPAGLMRAALAEAHHWVRHRAAFQRRLIDQPLMRAVLADLVLDLEGAAALVFRAAHAFDGSAATDRAFARIAVALAKYLNNKLCPLVVAEAMEVLGGMGYVEDTPLPMLYREAPLNGIWEGSGNVICLDIRRTLERQQAAAEALAGELDSVWGNLPAYDAALSAHRARWPGPPPEAEARAFAESAALLLAGASVQKHAPAAVAEAFVSTRLRPGRLRFAGTAPGLNPDILLARLGAAD
ncbi:MAG: acyl-CoA dehydrogenase family protein [Paracoccaceae bacterium]